MRLLKFFEYSQNWDDQSLVDGLKKKDVRAENAFYSKYYPKLAGKIKNMSSDIDQEDLSSVVDNAILKAIRKINLFDFKGSLDGWVLKIGQNCLYDFFKNKKDVNVKYVEEFPDISPSIDLEAKKNIKEIFSKFRKTLSELQSNIINLYLNGYSHKEIGEHMGMSEGTSRWHVNQIMNKFKTYYKKNIDK